MKLTCCAGNLSLRPIMRNYRQIDNVRVGISIFKYPELLKLETYVPERDLGGEG
tara:strand:- start:4399 stop:4560 length:162 start_codon:yes stop_codon:yes gene_type:complete